MEKQCETVACLTASQNCDCTSLLGSPLTETTSETVTQPLLVGTYALEEASQPDPQNNHPDEKPAAKRHGSVHLLHATRTACQFSLSLISTHLLPAVLDLIADPTPTDQFQTDVPHTHVFAACADGALLRLTSRPPYTSVTSHPIQPADASTKHLNLAVHAHYDRPHSATLLATSDSLGHISIRRSLPTGDLATLAVRRVHDAEAWCTHVAELTAGTTVMSGGDDGVLAAFETRSEDIVWKCRGAHDGVGVTCVTGCPYDALTVFSGGYDDRIRVWDTRLMKNCVEEVDVLGGVWRMRFHPTLSRTLLFAAMYKGAGILSCGDENGLQVVARYPEHDSIVYGAEWLGSLMVDEDERSVALTASFYDKQIRLWTV